MSKIEYFFEKDFWGNWKLVPRRTDNGAGCFFLAIIILFLIILAICIGIILSPLLFSLLGFKMVRDKRHYAGIASILAFIYFIFDLQNKWISSLLFFGYTNEQGEFKDGLFGEKYIEYCWVLNSIGVLLGVYFIVKFYLDKKNGVI